MPETPFPVLPLDAKVLVMCPIGLGNFIMATPALALLSRHLGRDNLGLLALKGAIAELGEASAWFGAIHRWDPDKEGLGRGLRLLSDIRRHGYSHSLSLFPTFHWKFGLFALASGIRQRIGFRHPQGKSLGFLSEPFSQALQANPEAHDTDQNLALVENLIGRKQPAPVRLTWPLPAHPPTKTPQDSEGPDYFVVHPGSSAERGMSDKRLPPEIFADLIARMHNQFGLQAVLVGGPEENELRKSIADSLQAAGQGQALRDIRTRNLTDLGGVVAGARLYLGNDSGIMHVAVALGIPCAAFFGPTSAQRTGPYGHADRLGGRLRHLVVGRNDLACRPCRIGANVGRNPECITRDIRCLRDFPAAAAWAQIEPFARQVLT